MRQGSAHPLDGARRRARSAGPLRRVRTARRGSGVFPPFCVLEFIDGISLRELRRRGEAAGVAEASYDAGRLLPRLMQHRFPRTGILSPELDVEDGPFADVSLLSVIDHFAASPLFAASASTARSARASNRSSARTKG